jgi:bacillithiol system protein YtxJ
MAAIHHLSQLEELDPLWQQSGEGPVLVFKHSVTCPISARARVEFEHVAASSSADGVVFALLEVQNARPLSDELARRAGVRHESPQALLLRSGAVTWHASHFAIRRDSLTTALAG